MLLKISEFLFNGDPSDKIGHDLLSQRKIVVRLGSLTRQIHAGQSLFPVDRE